MRRWAREAPVSSGDTTVSCARPTCSSRIPYVHICARACSCSCSSCASVANISSGGGGGRAQWQEFSCYLREVKKIEPEVLSNFDRKKYWKDYMEGSTPPPSLFPTPLYAVVGSCVLPHRRTRHIGRLQHVHDALQKVLRPQPVGNTPGHQTPEEVRCRHQLSFDSPTSCIVRVVPG